MFPFSPTNRENNYIPGFNSMCDVTGVNSNDLLSGSLFGLPLIVLELKNASIKQAFMFFIQFTLQH